MKIPIDANLEPIIKFLEESLLEYPGRRYLALRMESLDVRIVLSVLKDRLERESIED